MRVTTLCKLGLGSNNMLKILGVAEGESATYVDIIEEFKDLVIFTTK